MGAAQFVPCPEAKPIDVDSIQGQWYVVQSNLSMWRAKTCPRITYSNLRRDEQTGRYSFDDLVQYFSDATAESRGVESTIQGVDVEQSCPSSCAHSVYQWRGSGLLKLITSTWQVAYVSSDGEWAISVFDATPFTAAGVDVYCRTPKLRPDQKEEVQKVFARSTYLSERGIGLFDTHQQA